MRLFLLCISFFGIRATATVREIEAMNRAQLQESIEAIDAQLSQLSPLTPTYQSSRLGYHSSYRPSSPEHREPRSGEPLWTLSLKQTRASPAGKLYETALLPALVVRNGHLESYGFPRRFRLIGKNESGEHILVDYMDRDFPSPGPYPVVFELDTTLHLESFHLEVYKGVQKLGFEFFALGEWMVFGEHEDAPVAVQNIGPWMKLHAAESFSMPPYWSPGYLNDNQTALGLPLAAESSGLPDLLLRFDQPLSHPIHLYYETEPDIFIGRVHFYPGMDPQRTGVSGFGFPTDFSVRTFRHWSQERQKPEHAIETYDAIDLPSPGDNIHTVTINSRKTGCIQISISKLSIHERRPTLSLSELEFIHFGQKVGKLVHVEGIPPKDIAQVLSLTDRSARGQLILNRREWIRQLAKRGGLETKRRALLSRVDTLRLAHERLIRYGSAAIASLSVGILATGLIVNRVRSRRSEYALREQLAGDLHDDVGALLGCSMLAAKKLERNVSAEKHRKEVQRIIESTQQATQALRDIVWINNRSLSSCSDLVDKIQESAQSLSDYYQISYETKNLACVKNMQLRASQRRDVLFWVKECLNNIHKHAHASRILIRVAETNGQFEITIEDDGCGFDIERHGPDPSASVGFGLRSMKQRASHLNGRLTIQSEREIGTRVSLKFPLNKARIT